MHIIFHSRIVNTMVYYGLSYNTPNLDGNLYVNFFIGQMVEIPSVIVTMFLMYRQVKCLDINRPSILIIKSCLKGPLSLNIEVCQYKEFFKPVNNPFIRYYSFLKAIILIRKYK